MAPGGASRKSAGRARSALIVAVSSYASDNVSNLANTIIDAAKLQGALFKLGWSVEMALELGLEQAEKKVEEFAGRGAKGDDDCLFAFVGHGVELNGRNYLVAADSKFDAAYESEAKFEKAVKRGCLPFDDVQGDFKNARGSSAGATVFLLDCCRSGFSTNVGSGRSVAGCFTSRAADSSAIRPEFPNSIVIYSTTSGKVASDGVRGEGGPFMGIFCEEIASGAEVSVVMKSTRKKLLASAPDLCQLAPDNSFLLDDFFFSPQREQQDEAASGASHMVPARPGGTASGGGDDALLLLLREHDVEDAAAWLQREGATSRKHLLDVTEEDVHAAGLQKFVARRLVRMLAGLRDAAGGGGRAEAPVQVSLEGGEMETGVAGGGGVGPSENGVVQVLEESTDVAETVAAMVGGEAVLKAMEGGDGVGPRASHPPAPQSAAPPSAAPPPPPLHPPPDLEAGEASLAAEAPEPLSRDSTEVAKLELVGKEDTSEDVAQVVHLVGLDAARAGDKFTFAAALRRAIKRQDGRDYQPREQVFRAVSLSKVPSTHKKPPPP
ncbi:hypothetical protein T484DRAFT_1959761 [Baffinella frigidus]|nr:hypothetical protein T484DRAFT_1959761 [Cryptophyta sp. CCMP2293]